MKKRIAHVAGGLTTGGVEAVVYNYFSNIDLTEYELHYIAYDTPNPEVQKKFEDLGFQVHAVTKKKDNLWKSCVEVYRILKDNQINIVHSHMTLMSFVTSFLGMLCGVKVRIAHSHLAQYPTGMKKIVYAFFKCFTRMTSNVYFACGREAGNYLFGKNNMKKGNVRIINNAVDTKKFSYQEELRKTKREQLGIGERICIGNVGRFTEQKNHTFLLDAFAKVHESNANTVLLLVGEGPLQEEMKQKANMLGLSDSVIFTGSRNDVDELYQVMDVFALPSLYEGLAVVLVETQCAGLQVLTSDTVTKEIEITDNITYLPLNDLAVWTKEMLEACNRTRQESKTHPDTIRKAGYDIEKEARDLDKMYEELLQGKKV